MDLGIANVCFSFHKQIMTITWETVGFQVAHVVKMPMKREVSVNIQQ